jgi:hypothetical protein
VLKMRVTQYDALSSGPLGGVNMRYCTDSELGKRWLRSQQVLRLESNTVAVAEAAAFAVVVVVAVASSDVAVDKQKAGKSEQA